MSSRSARLDGMRAAAHALAVGVEHQRGHIGQAVRRHRLARAAPAAARSRGGGDLPDEPPGVGKPGLDRHPPARAGIGAVGVLGEQRVEEAPAVFERGLGLEQRRDVDLVGDPEQPREIERGEHRRGLLAFGDQHADRRVGVDVVEDLRHRQELADRGRALDRQRGEIGAQRLRTRRAARASVTIAPWLARSSVPSGSSRRRIALWSCAGVHPEVDPAHAQPVGAHRRGERLAAPPRAPVRRSRASASSRAISGGEREQLGGIVGGQPVGGGGERVRVGQVAGEVRGARRRIGGSVAQGRRARRGRGSIASSASA